MILEADCYAGTKAPLGANGGLLDEDLNEMLHDLHCLHQAGRALRKS